MNNFFMNFPGNKIKAVTLSYDDGCRYDIKFSNAKGMAGQLRADEINAEGI